MSEINHQIVNALFEPPHADQPWALIVLAALEGEASLHALLDGVGTVQRPVPVAPVAGNATEPPGAYVAAITVEGFRGVGPSATLSIRPGPGLTLVVGRNGSGKSSFAEGLEYTLTGRNYRWEERAKAWSKGWRNLHHDSAALKADLLVEGKGPVSVARKWTGDELDSHDVKCTGPAKQTQTLESIGWDTALSTFRPFLSYNELGTLLEDGPSKLYDALSGVLGLSDLVAVQTLLAATKKSRQALCDEAKDGAAEIVSLIDAVPDNGGNDDRLDRARTALRTSAWNLAALTQLLQNENTVDVSQLEMLRRIESIPPADVTGVSAVVARLKSAAKALGKLAGSDAERSRQRADLLEQALSFHESHHDQTCPVCNTTNVLGEQWAASSRDAIATLRKEAAACESATAGARSSVREAQRFLSPPPPFLAQAHTVGLAGLKNARTLWIDWAAGRDIDTPAELAAHLEGRVLEFAEAVQTLVEQAAAERGRREDTWRPIAAAIQAWLPTARQAVPAKDQVKQLKAAEDWWKDAAATIRDERFAPIAERARAVWNQLRLQSNVDLGGVVLEGTAGRRRVVLQVTVDGTPAEALGVMSQGELHSLALSLFLPRATLPESPFRFICIDDPVQSMDPTRVEGLARALADAAKTRQVIVFTHDDRLPQAVRRLGLQANVHSVTRRARSVVEVREVVDPMTTLIDDARAVTLTEDLPTDVAARVVPGFCRAAVEAACMEVVRRRRLTSGETHDAVEELLATNARTHPLMALALFDDEKRTSEVMPKLLKVGSWAVDVFKICKAGAHERHEGDLKLLVDYSARLVKHLAASH
ncbi:MAG TPA: AAA family ATPase [Vicinamibacterales bacterium]|nr:AAA family ATPase [Vicinamibacterales bacterium]